MLAASVTVVKRCFQCVRDHQAEGLHELGDRHHGVNAVQRHSQEPTSHLRAVHARQGLQLLLLLASSAAVSASFHLKLSTYIITV